MFPNWNIDCISEYFSTRKMMFCTSKQQVEQIFSVEQKLTIGDGKNSDKFVGLISVVLPFTVAKLWFNSLLESYQLDHENDIHRSGA